MPSLIWILIGVGLLATVLQGANLVYIARHFDCAVPSLACESSISPWRTPDSGGYALVAEQIRSRGLLRASYLYRTPGYPLLLLLAASVSGQPSGALWIACLLAGCAAAALAWMSFLFTSSRNAAVLAGLLFCAWPNSFQYTPLLITDAAHAYFCVLAVAATLRWWKRPSAWAAVLSAGSWMVSQSIRPTFFPLPFLLPLLIWNGSDTARPLRQKLGLWLASLLVPVILVLSNFTHHRMLTVSVLGAETMASFTLPRLEESLGLGSFEERRALSRALYEPMGLAVRVAAQRHHALALMWAHPGATAVDFLAELQSQILWPLRPGYSPHLESLYPRWMSVPSSLLAFYWLSALAGLVLLFRNDPRWALFLLAMFGVVMAPATLSHMVGGRLRFPLDLLFLPFAVLCWHSVGRRTAPYLPRWG